MESDLKPSKEAIEAALKELGNRHLTRPYINLALEEAYAIDFAKVFEQIDHAIATCGDVQIMRKLSTVKEAIRAVGFEPISIQFYDKNKEKYGPTLYLGG